MRTLFALNGTPCACIQNIVLKQIVEMEASALRKFLSDFGLSCPDFSRLVSVTSRAVNQWVAGEREIPWPAAAYIRLFCSLPKALQKQELALKSGDRHMFDGLYEFVLTGKNRQKATATLIFSKGQVFGCHDRVSYDGTFEPLEYRSDVAVARIYVTVPANVELIMGHQAVPYERRFDISVGVGPGAANRELVPTPDGNLQVTIRFLREIPDLAA